MSLSNLMEKKNFLILLLLITACLYFLAGVLINPLIIWVAGPLFISYPLFASGKNSNTPAKCYAAYGYLLGGAGFSLLYHFAWFFDWGQTKTGGSTSALIFAVFPVYAIIIGLFFSCIGYAIGKSNS